MALPDAGTARSWGGKTVIDRYGAVIGACTQVYTDDATGLPEWAAVRIGQQSTLVPLLDAVEVDGQVQIGPDRDTVVRAPSVADRHHVTPQDEVDLYRHYGIEVSPERSSSLLPAGEGPRPARTDREGDRRFAYLLAGLALAGLALLTVLSARAERRRRAGSVR
jgi:hypothetical protein